MAGRIPNYRNRCQEFRSVEAYVEAVRDKKVRDPVLGFQMRNGFEPIGVLRDYLPVDEESGGYAVHLLWTQPAVRGNRAKSSDPRRHRSVTDRIRLATVQYKPAAYSFL